MTSPLKIEQKLLAPVSFWQALLFWLKLGFISFGGPAGQIALMHHELVEKRHWISEKRFLHALNYCMLLPGPEAQQLATYIGWLMYRNIGGIVAGVLFVLPALVLLIALSWIYLRFGNLPIIAGIFYGIKPAVAALVLQATHRMAGRTLKNSLLWSIAILAFIAIAIFHLPFPIIIACAALIGFIASKKHPEKFQTGNAHKSTKQQTSASPLVPVWLDDHSPTPQHATFSWQRFMSILFIGISLWTLPIAYLTYTYGWTHDFTQMAWFFTKAALLTFGGAYAVLPYVYQGAVNHYGWLSASQMMDGLALGETTPGPLIIVVSFVGFVAGYGKALLGMDHLLLAGTIAACIVTWFTFLPSFIFILAGGPIVEASRHQLTFTAPLTAITAAIVGVVFSLALFFSFHAVYPKGLSLELPLALFTNIDWAALLIGFGACIALIRYKFNVIYIIFTSACIGMVLKLW